jgi:hypothetical protein
MCLHVNIHCFTMFMLTLYDSCYYHDIKLICFTLVLYIAICTHFDYCCSSYNIGHHIFTFSIIHDKLTSLDLLHDMMNTAKM